MFSYTCRCARDCREPCRKHWRAANQWLHSTSTAPREVCLDGETGFLLRAEDVDGLARAVIRLLQDKELAHRMGERGRGLVRERFSEDRMVQQLDELYRHLRPTRD